MDKTERKIEYHSTYEEIDQVALALNKRLTGLPIPQRFLGLWLTSDGQPSNHTALVHLATDEVSYVLDVSNMRTLPHQLTCLLEDEDTVFITCDLTKELRVLENAYNIRPEVLNLRHLLRLSEPGWLEGGDVHRLVEEVFGIRHLRLYSALPVMRPTEEERTYAGKLAFAMVDIWKGCNCRVSIGST